MPHKRVPIPFIVFQFHACPTFSTLIVPPDINTPCAIESLRKVSGYPDVRNLLRKMSLLHGRVSRFRKGHSTTTTQLGIRDDIRRAMKKGEISLMVLADFSKAFDTLCFENYDSKILQVRLFKDLSEMAAELLIGPNSIYTNRRQVLPLHVHQIRNPTRLHIGTTHFQSLRRWLKQHPSGYN